LFSNSAARWTFPHFIVTLRMVRHKHCRRQKAFIFSQEIDRRSTMRRIAVIAIMGISIVANVVLAQQSAAKPETEEQDSLPRVEEQLKVLNEKLGLTAKQQAKVNPILQQLHDATEHVMRDQTLSREERLAKVRPQRQMADKKVRTILNDEQRKKLDQYEQGPHHEVHGNVSGRPKPPAR
jgi:hypothetical protein